MYRILWKHISFIEIQLLSNQKLIYPNLDVARKSDTTEYIQIFDTYKFHFSQATTKQTSQVESFRSLGASGILILSVYIQRKLFFLWEDCVKCYCSMLYLFIFYFTLPEIGNVNMILSLKYWLQTNSSFWHYSDNEVIISFM